MLDIPQRTELYTSPQIKSLTWTIENIMRGVVNEMLDYKLNQKFKPIESRLAKIEKILLSRHIIGVQNLMLSRDVIDEIWDEEDDTI